MQKKFVTIILVIILISIGSWLRLADLGEQNFQNDEFFHLETAQGYLETGDFVMWDFIKEEPAGEYIRAFPYTWLVAQSFKIFGISEWAGRLPSVFFGILLLPLLYLITLKITKSRLISLLVLVLLVFDNSLIWSSRVCRMYSMLVFFSTFSTYLIYLGFEQRLKFKYYNYLLLAIGLALLGFSYLIHEVALIIGLGFTVYLLINSIYYLFINKEYTIKNKYHILSGLFLITLIGGLLFNFFVHPLTTNEFFTLRDAPNWIYLEYPFNQLQWFELGWLFLILGGLIWKRWDKMKLYYLSLGIPVILFFVFIAQRYPAKKYVILIVPFLLIFYVDGIYHVFRKLFFKKKYFYIVLIYAFIVIGPLFSWPGIEASFFMQTARADETHHHDFRSAYAYVEQNYRAGEPLLVLRAHSYYFSRSDLNMIGLGSYKSFTLNELKEYHQDFASGWVIWPKYKDYHLSKEFEQYCDKKMEYIEDLEQTNMVVYRW